MNLVRALAVYTALALIGIGFVRVYGYGASNGMLGYEAWQNYERQSSGRYGVLIGGRADFLVGLENALDSPIIGHGSWASDWHYEDRAESMLADLGYWGVGSQNSWLIPAHSHLIGAWVHAGILGAVFWAWVVVLALRVLSRVYRTDEPLSPLIAFLAVILIWDILFSPYGAERRFITPYYVVVMMSYLTSTPQSRESY